MVVIPDGDVWRKERIISTAKTATNNKPNPILRSGNDTDVADTDDSRRKRNRDFSSPLLGMGGGGGGGMLSVTDSSTDGIEIYP